MKINVREDLDTKSELWHMRANTALLIEIRELLKRIEKQNKQRLTK